MAQSWMGCPVLIVIQTGQLHLFPWPCVLLFRGTWGQMGEQVHVLSAQVGNHPISQMGKLCCRSGKYLLQAGPFHIWNLPI